MSFVTSVLGAIIAYLTSLWSVARMVFGVLDTQLMADCFGLLSVVFLIYIVDALPTISRKKKGILEKLPQIQPRGMKPIIVWVKDE